MSGVRKFSWPVFQSRPTMHSGRKLTSLERLPQAEGAEDLHAVGGHLDAGADFAERGSALEDVRVEAECPEGPGQGHAADAAADDADPWPRHVALCRKYRILYSALPFRAPDCASLSALIRT